MTLLLVVYGSLPNHFQNLYHLRLSIAAKRFFCFDCRFLMYIFRQHIRYESVEILNAVFHLSNQPMHFGKALLHVASDSDSTHVVFCAPTSRKPSSQVNEQNESSLFVLVQATLPFLGLVGCIEQRAENKWKYGIYIIRDSFVQNITVRPEGVILLSIYPRSLGIR